MTTNPEATSMLQRRGVDAEWSGGGVMRALGNAGRQARHQWERGA